MKALELLQSGMSRGDVCAETGLSRDYVSRLANRAGIPPEAGPWQERYDKVVALLRGGMPQKEIARRVGLSPQRVSEIGRKTGVLTYKIPPRHVKKIEVPRWVHPDNRPLYRDLAEIEDEYAAASYFRRMQAQHAVA
jgi:transcriptional regulator with XRE-family HTH domain